jgi:hypothetical protein
LCGAVLSAFRRRAEVYYVQIAKKVRRPTRENAVRKAGALFEQHLAAGVERINAGERIEELDQDKLIAVVEKDLEKRTDAAGAPATRRPIRGKQGSRLSSAGS